MKVNRLTVTTLLVGAALGAAAIQTLHAQAKPPVYVVVDIEEITDPAGYAAIGGRSAEAAAAVFKEYGGRFLARTDKITALDGNAPKRSIINAFDSKEKALAWYNSAAQKDVTAIRTKTTRSRAFLVEGM
jgi:uncharacterized protein (DUF1330 family)